MSAAPVTGQGSWRPGVLVGGGGVVIAVIAVIGWLVWPRSPAPVVLNTGTPQHLVTVTVDRLRLGTTDIDITITDRAGVPIDHGAVLLQANQPLMGHAGQPVTAAPMSPGHFHAAGVALMMTGPWDLRLSIDTHDGGEQLTLPVWVGG
ncbi:FixH family protein [Nocardia sp. CWNU-33]|uniref:FixH family protein n=1 Tax=Nocardia sp. CWNU-33 TaxID=3392117 RepID=UPI00398F7CEF